MRVYFDNSATTEIAPEVLKSLSEVLQGYYGNPASLHQLGLEAEQLMKRARGAIAKQLHIKPKEVIFTSGGTESNNLALKGAAFAFQSRGKHIITSKVEHSSVYQVCQELEEQFGFKVTYLDVDRHGLISVEELKQSITEETILVSIMHVNNEIGSVQPIEEIGKLLSSFPKLLFHVDQVQGFSKVPLSIRESKIDLLSISGHKIHAPKGSGLLYVREGIKLYPLFHGGNQQESIRPGTENVAFAVALARAIRLVKEQEVEHQAYIEGLKERMIRIVGKYAHVYIHAEQHSAPHILNVSFAGIKPEVLLHALEEKGIFVSTKSACSSKTNVPSRILLALGLPVDIAGTAIRFSFSMYNKQEELDYFEQVIDEILPYYQKILKV